MAMHIFPLTLIIFFPIARTRIFYWIWLHE